MEIKPRKLTEKQIASNALEFLVSIYGSDFSKINLPIDVDSIVEMIGADLVFDDFEDPTVLGAAIQMGGRERHIIKIASSLADDLELEPRFRFTVAHELGHVCLHFPLVPLLNGQINLLDSDYYQAQPIVLCRESGQEDKEARYERTNYDWLEWQANVFAANLLMPEPLIRKHFEMCIEQIGTDTSSWQDFNFYSNKQRCITAMKSHYKVSYQSMEIRVNKLGLFDDLLNAVFSF